MNYKIPLFYLLIPIFVGSISISQGQVAKEIIEGEESNYIDENNLKQGFWKIFGRMKKLPGYEPNQVIEQGNYNNSQKKGLWTYFFPSGKTKNEITYKKGRQNGTYKLYYQNGALEEEGNWKNNRHIGKFIRKHENGEMAQEFVFADNGHRDGQQKYYNDQGVLIIDALIKDGREEKVIEYHDDGSLKAEKYFIDGKLDEGKTKTYAPKNPIKPKIEGKDKFVGVQLGEKPNPTPGLEKFSGNGTHKLYNLNKQISKDGFFKNYRLMEGLWYKYENGILVSIEKYKNGRYIGDVPLPKE